MNTHDLDLKEEVEILLGRSEEPIRSIARNADVTSEWLFAFQKGRIKDPGYKRLTKLKRYLSNTVFKAAG